MNIRESICYEYSLKQIEEIVGKLRELSIGQNMIVLAMTETLMRQVGRDPTSEERHVDAILRAFRIKAQSLRSFPNPTRH